MYVMKEARQDEIISRLSLECNRIELDTVSDVLMYIHNIPVDDIKKSVPDQSKDKLEQLEEICDREDRHMLDAHISQEELTRAAETSKKNAAGIRQTNTADQIAYDIHQIENVGAHKEVMGWGKRCEEARKHFGITAQEAAKLCGVSHTAILKQERINDAYDVPIFYLHAFSLLYRCSPYELLGKKNPYGMSALISIDDDYSRFSNIVMETLYVEDDPQKLKYLRTITKIGQMHYAAITDLLAIFNHIPRLKDVPKTDLSCCKAAEATGWRKRQLLPPLKEEQKDSEEYYRQYTFYDAYFTLEDLLEHNGYQTMKLMAQIAVADCAVKDILTVIIDNGFVKKSFKKHDIDAFIFR